MIRKSHVGLVFIVGVLAHGTAFAQSTGAGGGAAPAGGGGGAAPAGGGGGSTTTTTTTQSTVVAPPVITYPGAIAPTAPGQNLGGGNATQSSSKPLLGPNDRDGFDFGTGSGGATVHGSENSSFVLGSIDGRGFGVPGVHVVRRGDTLWGICDSYFHNPYQWPRVWSYNPQIQNPHWIYPGDQVRLRGGSLEQPNAPGSAIIDRRRSVPSDTIFLRNQGYIEDEKNTNWGEISGSPEDKMILTDHDEAYLRIASERDLKVGQELTVWRPVKSVGGGRLIQIQGTVRVDQWNGKEHIARARITESLDAIERGTRVGPVTRRFEVVPPARDDVDVTGTVLTSVQPNILFANDQVIFIDKGESDGLKPGNRLLVLKKGDAWHDSLTTRSSAKRIALESDSPALVENIPRPRNEDALPEEVQAEIRVVNVKKKTAMCIVTQSRREIEPGDQAYARKGY